MGGNAFPNLKDRMVRLNSVDYNKFKDNVLSSLRWCWNDTLPSAIYSEIISYNSKDSFGDLDIIYTEFLESGEVMTPIELKITLGAVDMVCNGPVTNFAVPLLNGTDKLFQVDLIRVKFEEFDAAFSYFAYNDLGNLLGRVFHRAGFKLGHTGMSYIIRDDQNSSHAVKEVVLTRSWKHALEFAGYDYEKWVEGFDTLEDVFRYAVSNEFANRTIFRLDETNHQARVRDRKRKTYNQFLQWVNDPANNVIEKEKIPKKELRIQWLVKAFHDFPQFKADYDEAQNLLQKNRIARDKFNGNLVMEITGLNGKELGAFMTDFVQNFVVKICKMCKEDWAISRSNEEIATMIRHWHNQRSV